MASHGRHFADGLKGGALTQVGYPGGLPRWTQAKPRNPKSKAPFLILVREKNVKTKGLERSGSAGNDNGERGQRAKE